jgi:membrane protein YqaA with SNARE-associated domain
MRSIHSCQSFLLFCHVLTLLWIIGIFCHNAIYLYHLHIIPILMTLKILTVAALATFEIYAAIPAGFAFKLSPWIIFLASLSGGLVGVYVAVFLGERIKRLLARFRKPREEKPKTGIIYRIWEKYGIIGLGFLGTMTVGAPVSIGVGVGFNVPLKKMMVWCCLGVLVRCALFTTLGHLGMKLL